MVQRGREGSKESQERYAGLEMQNNQLSERVRDLERQQSNADRLLCLAETQKRDELYEKDQHLHEMQCHMKNKDVQLQEMERLSREKDLQLQEMERLSHEKDVQLRDLERYSCEKDQQMVGLQEHHRQSGLEIHDKDQTLQQIKHEHQKLDDARTSQLQDLNKENSELRQKLRFRDEAFEAEQDAMSRRMEEKAEGARIEAHLKKKLQEAKIHIESLETQLRRCSSAASLVSPGEFMRMMKNSEAKNSFSVDNARLFSRNSELESEAMLIKKEISLLRRHVPTEVVGAIWREAAIGAKEEEDDVSQPVHEPEP
jgi:hypothetical protein